MSNTDALNTKSKLLGPWRYNHEHGSFKIQGDPVAAPIHDDYGYGRETMKHIIAKVCEERDPSTMRALDLGCLEGHYSDLLCQQGFSEVVAVDLSSEQVARAKFLLQEVRAYKNATILQGSVEDKGFMESIGKFDLILFHGLLYHLKDPIGIFETFQKIGNLKHTLLLSTQFKFTFAEIITPFPIANIKFRTLPPNANNLVRYEGVSSTYATTAMRFNPIALKRLLDASGYRQIIHYDTTLGCRYGFQVNLIASGSTNSGLIDHLNHGTQVPGLQFSKWGGDRLDSYSLKSGWRLAISRFSLRVAYSVCERLGKSGTRHEKRAEIAHHVRRLP